MGSRYFPLGLFQDDDDTDASADSENDENKTDSKNDDNLSGHEADTEAQQEWEVAMTRKNKKKAIRAERREARIQRKLEKKLAKEELKANVKDEFIDFSLPLVALHVPTEEEIDLIFKVIPDKIEKCREIEDISKSYALKEMTLNSDQNAWEKDIRQIWFEQGPEKPFINQKRTENNALTFVSSGDAKVDFFFQVMETTCREQTEKLVSQSWNQDPLDTLKLIAYLRNCRQGKGVRHSYQVCLYWLYKTHPRTLYENLKTLASFGYWKDLLHLLMTICFEGLIPHYLELDDSPAKKKTKKQISKYLKKKIEHCVGVRKQDPGVKRYHYVTKRKNKEVLMDALWNNKGTLVYNTQVIQMYIKYIDSDFKLRRPIQYEPKKVIRDACLKIAKYRLETDSKYSLFFNQIAKLFAEQILTDKAQMDKEEKLVSLAGKWAPDLKGHFDKYTLIGTGVALELVKLKNQTFEMEKPCESVRCYLARKVYHKEYLVELKKYLQIPEVYMSAQAWAQLNYKRVPSLCMFQNMKIFANHDKERFENFVEHAKSIPGMTLKPHQIVGKIMDTLQKGNFQIENDSEDGEEEKKVLRNEIFDNILEKQWKSIVEDIRKNDGAKFLRNSIAVCDVSGSMEGEPMIAAISLSLLVMELNNPPWNEFCITFHHQPSIFEVKVEDSLKDKVQKMLQMEWGYNTNFNLVFELILSAAKAVGDNEEVKNQMPSTVFVFTDMEFDEAFSGADETNFEVVKRRFDEEGFPMPNIVFWNLRGDSGQRSVPVEKDEDGTVLMSGFSGQQLKLILKSQDMEQMTPENVMLKAIKSKIYDKLKIFD